MKINRIISLLLCFTFCLSLFATPASASLVEDADAGTRVAISNRAGKGGSYHYDVDSGTETYIPPDATLADFGIFDDIPQSSSQDDDLSLEEIDPDLDEIMESYLADESRAGDNRYSVANPTQYELSTCLLGARFDDAGVTHVESKGKCLTGVHSGTDWLINNRYLVTAGHMVYDWEHLNNGNDGWAKHVAIYVGGDYKDCTNGKDYPDFAMFDDWAVIKLKNPISNPPSNMSILSLKETNDYTEMSDKSFTTQGYPMDLNPGKDFKQFTMYKQTVLYLSNTILLRISLTWLLLPTQILRLVKVAPLSTEMGMRKELAKKQGTAVWPLC